MPLDQPRDWPRGNNSLLLILFTRPLWMLFPRRSRKQQEVNEPDNVVPLHEEKRRSGTKPNMSSRTLTPYASLIIPLWPPHCVEVVVVVSKMRERFDRCFVHP